jgi:hypothetical protein
MFLSALLMARGQAGKLQQLVECKIWHCQRLPGAGASCHAMQESDLLSNIMTFGPIQMDVRQGNAVQLLFHAWSLIGQSQHSILVEATESYDWSPELLPAIYPCALVAILPSVKN